MNASACSLSAKALQIFIRERRRFYEAKLLKEAGLEPYAVLCDWAVLSKKIYIIKYRQMFPEVPWDEAF